MKTPPVPTPVPISILASLLISFAMLLGGFEAFADEAPLGLPVTSTLSAVEQSKVARGLGKVLKESYLYPEKARALAEALESFSREALVEPIEAGELARILTEKLYELSDDLHFYVGVDEEWIREQRSKDDPETKRKLQAKELLHEERQNFGFAAVEILEGNVGYLRFNHFADPDIGQGKLATAMDFLAHCDAYILDLRTNNGGVVEMAQLLASYFFTSESDQLFFDYYYFEDGKRVARTQRVLPSVPGARRPDAPLYILVSSASFSAAEWFAFMMRETGRGEVIGERTAGGAHPVDLKAIDERFVVNVPIGAMLGPNGDGAGDFEGVGVEPTEAVAATTALPIAHKMALEKLMESHPELRAGYQWLLPVIEARGRPPVLDSGWTRALVGSYGRRSIVSDEGVLYYLWHANGKIRIKLTPLSKSLLALDGIDDFRFRVLEEDGKVIALERIDADGSTRRYPRTS